MYHPFKDAMRGTLSLFPTGGKPLTIRWNSPNGRRSLITNVSSKSVPFVVPSYGSAFHPCIYFPTHPLSNNRFVLQTRYARIPILIYTTMRNRLPTPRCYPDSRDLRARAAPPALLDTQPFRQSSKYSFTIVEQLTPRPMLPLPHLSDFDDDDDDVHPAPSVPPRATTHCRHSRHITTLRTTNLTEIDFYDILGIPCSRIDDRWPSAQSPFYHEHYFYIPRHLSQRTTPPLSSTSTAKFHSPISLPRSILFLSGFKFPLLNNRARSTTNCTHHQQHPSLGILIPIPLPYPPRIFLGNYEWGRATNMVCLARVWVAMVPNTYLTLLPCTLRVCGDRSTIRIRHQRVSSWLPVSYSRCIVVGIWMVRSVSYPKRKARSGCSVTSCKASGWRELH